MKLLTTLLLVLAVSAAWAAEPSPEPAPQPQAIGAALGGAKPPGWWLPTVGPGNGGWELSIGSRFWKDELHIRNLIAQAEVDLGPGLRAHVLARHNREVDSLEGFRPNLDEAYLEGYGFYKRPQGTLSLSLRVGKVRYLRFPEPDAIAMFEQVPGVADLQGRFQTGYSGAVLAAEYAHDSGLGAHFTGIWWGLDHAGGANAIEDYAFYRSDFGAAHFEARAGGIASRKEPLGAPAHRGYDLYLGFSHRDWTVGALYEKREHDRDYTGVMIMFPYDRVTRALGSAGFDYTRDPQGFVLQIPVADGHFGFARKEPSAADLVGEIIAVRIRTYWQAGLIRNFYEHRVSQWGETGDPSLVVTVDEQPYYLMSEALVSPHTKIDSRWFHDRQGPAHNARLVIYRFYRQRP